MSMIEIYAYLMLGSGSAFVAVFVTIIFLKAPLFGAPAPKPIPIPPTPEKRA